VHLAFLLEFTLIIIIFIIIKAIYIVQVAVQLGNGAVCVAFHMSVHSFENNS